MIPIYNLYALVKLKMVKIILHAVSYIKDMGYYRIARSSYQLWFLQEISVDHLSKRLNIHSHIYQSILSSTFIN